MVAALGLAKQQALLRGHLNQVVAVLEPLRELDVHLYERLRPLLHSEVTKLSNRVQQIDNSPAPAVAFRELREEANGLFTECLGFLGGAVALHAGLDRGLCRIANHIVAELRTEGELAGYSVSVPAESEYVNSLSSLIRVRFPGEGIWDLPAVVHEFGHAVCDQLGRGAARAAVTVIASRELPEPVGALTASGARPGRLLAGRYEELWADVVGAYVCGPAYAATCLRLRFDPASAGESDSLATHPSADKRVAAILTTLRHIEGHRAATGTPAGSLVSTIDSLALGWQAELAAVFHPALSEAGASAASAAATEFCSVLDNHVPTLRYDGLSDAEAVQYRLDVGGDRPAVGIIDILNGAWLARLSAEAASASTSAQHLAALGERALAWSGEVASA